jgi:predicted ATP-grasp superfamily ATP-dependent carboligase
MDILKKNEIPLIDNGVIVGLAGVLLNEGVNRNYDVVILLSEAHAEYPDARAAAAVTAAIDKILLHIELDTKPLLAEAAELRKGSKKSTRRPARRTNRRRCVRSCMVRERRQSRTRRRRSSHRTSGRGNCLSTTSGSSSAWSSPLP